jgi:pyridoxine 5-phosphate synthase
MVARLNVNIDHVATVRQARRAAEPSIVAAAMICELAGADGITIHLRQDRRHIQDSDLYALRQAVTTYLNVEMAATREMVEIAEKSRPDAVTLVAETPEEITTEGGLDVLANRKSVEDAVKALGGIGIITSLFIDPEADQVRAAKEAGADQIELCTSKYSDATLPPRFASDEWTRKADTELERLKSSADLALKLGLRVAAGHGLTYRNVGRVAAIEAIEEFNIGHNIISRAVLTGLETAVKEMIESIKKA